MRQKSALPFLLAVGAAIGVMAYMAIPKEGPTEPLGHRTEQSIPANPSCTPEQLVEPRKDPATHVVFLLDTSGSYHKSDAFLESAKGFVTLATQLAKNLPKPVLIRVAAIGNSSAGRPLVCDDVYVAASSFFSKKPCRENTASYQIEKCEERIRSLGADGYTEITWALDRAQRLMGQPTEIVRGIVIMSDLHETLPPGVKPATPNLTGTCVVGIWESKTIERDSEAMRERIAKWEVELRQMGVQAVAFHSLLSVRQKTTLFLDFLRSCSQ